MLKVDIQLGVGGVLESSESKLGSRDLIIAVIIVVIIEEKVQWENEIHIGVKHNLGR